MPTVSGLSWIAILVATLVSTGLGAAWYSPALFGNAWLAALGKSSDELGKPGPAMAGSVASCFVAAVAMEFVLTWLGVDTLAGGLGVGALAGIGFVATAMLSDSLFSGWGWRLYLIQTGYRVLYLMLVGAICGGWPS